METTTREITSDTACESAVNEIREKILSREGAVTAGTLTPVALHLNDTKNELTKLRGLTDEVDKVIAFLRKNSNDLAKCTDHIQQYPWWDSIWGYDPRCPIEGNGQLNEALRKLSQKQSEFRKQIDSINGKLDAISLTVIVINVAMIIEGVRTYITDAATVEEYSTKLDKMLQRIAKYKLWFDGSPKGERERNYFWQKIQECNVELVKIESEVKFLRKSNVTRAFMSATVGLGTVAMTTFLPMSAPILYGMLVSGVANAGSSTLNIRLVGKIDALLPIISKINTLICDCRSLISKDSSDFPNFD